jgi:hypothetical protein
MTSIFRRVARQVALGLALGSLLAGIVLAGVAITRFEALMLLLVVPVIIVMPACWRRSGRRDTAYASRPPTPSARDVRKNRLAAGDEVLSPTDRPRPCDLLRNSV